MKELTAYQCEECHTVFVTDKKAKVCEKKCTKKRQAKLKSRAFIAKLTKNSDWFRLNLKSVSGLGPMIEKFYHKFYKQKVSVRFDRDINYRSGNNFLYCRVEVSSLDGKSISYDPMTSGEHYRFYRERFPIIKGMSLDGCASGHGSKVHAQIKLDLDECPKIKILMDKKNSLKERAKEYRDAEVKARNKLNDVIKSDEEYSAHQDRGKIFSTYSAFANKLADERKQLIQSNMGQIIRNEFVTKELENDFVKFSELCNILHTDIA